MRQQQVTCETHVIIARVVFEMGANTSKLSGADA